MCQKRRENHCFKMLGSVEEAEEVVLDVFSQVWRTAQQYDAKRGRVDAWLFLSTRSRALARLRASQRQVKAVKASADAVQVKPSSPVATGCAQNLLVISSAPRLRRRSHR